MPTLVIYLLKVNAALCLFYLAYRFALRPLTFYYLNRFFLVFGIVFSTAYPFVDVSALFNRHEAIRQQLTTIVPDWHAVLPVVQQQVAKTDYWGIPIALFWIGAFLMAVKLAAQFVSLYTIRKSSLPAEHWGHSYRSVDGDINPFSFWQDIYLNPGKHSADELRSIIKHEQVHVKQWHTLDVILAELATVFYWFNPGVWFMKQAVKENLEFITDREILRSGVDEKAYQYSLVRVSALKPGAAIVNNFNFLTIKKRIMMMNKKSSSKAQITKYVILLPLIILLALVFTVSKAELSNKSIVVLVNKLLPKAIAIKQPKIAAQTELPPLPGDTVKPKGAIIMRDTFKQVMILRKDTLHENKPYVIEYDKNDTVKKAKVYKMIMNMHVDTLKVADGKPAKTLKGDKKIYLNYAYTVTADPKVIVTGADNQPINVSAQAIDPKDIDSIKILNNQSGSGKTYTGYRTVVIKVKPNTTFSTATSNSTAAVITDHALTNVKAVNDADVVNTVNISGTYLIVARDKNAGDTKGQLFESYSNLNSIAVKKGDKIVKGQVIGDVNVNPANGEPAMVYEVYNGTKLAQSNANNVYHINPHITIDDKDLVYMIDPKNSNSFSNDQIEGMRKMFEENGFNLKVRTGFSGDKLKSLNVLINSKKKSSSASAGYTNSDMGKVDYMIKILADKTTGAVSVMAVKR